MRLPDQIEQAIRELEVAVDKDKRSGQQVGPVRFHSLRFAIEDFLKSIKWTYPIPKELVPDHFCGLSGFGAPGDICPGCDYWANKRKNAK